MSNNNLSFASYSFGCRVNQAEKEALDKELLNLNYQYSLDHQDIYIINTCAVTQKAEREAKQLIYKLKRDNPNVFLIVTGCAATNWINLGRKVAGIDLLIDNKNKKYIAGIISKQFKASKLSSKDEQRQVYKLKTKFINSGRYLLKIQDGCQRFCSYCIVPYLRGLPQSVSAKSIIEEINKLFENENAQEVILTAINTEAYGYETDEKFVDLIDQVIKKTNINRLSFGSIHPWSLDEQFFNWYENNFDNAKLVDFFHVPLQSGSNDVLQRMKRGYKTQEMQEKLAKIAHINPLALIATDVIVGYLGESEKEFTETYQFLKESPISKFHVFKFSMRENTAAWHSQKIFQPVSLSVKKERSKALINLSKLKYNSFLQMHIDKEFDVLLLSKFDDKYQHGLLSNQVPVIIEENNSLVGKIKKIKIISEKNQQLFGKILA